MTRSPNTKKIKVCLVTVSLGNGGAERSCAMLSQMLFSLNYEVFTVILNNDVTQEYAGTLFNMGLFKNSGDTFVKRLLRFRKLRAFIKEQKFDFVIDHRPKNQLTRETFYDKYVYKGVKRVYVVHSSRVQTYLSNIPQKLAKIYNRNYRTVAVSKHIETQVLEKHGIQHTVTIHNAFNPDWIEKTGLVPEIIKDQNYILSYGRLDDSIKDFSFLITSFSESEVWKKDITLVIMGDGIDLEKLKELANTTEAHHHIFFLPHTSNPFPILKNARFITLTSRYEGFPMVLVESLSVGTPVVSLDIVSGPSEIIKDKENGLLVSKRSIPLFAEALRKMCSNEALYGECKNNAQSSVALYSMTTIARKWDQLLQHGSE